MLWEYLQLLSQSSNFGLGISQLHHQVLLCFHLLLLRLHIARIAARLWTADRADRALFLLRKLCYSLQKDVLCFSTKSIITDPPLPPKKTQKTKQIEGRHL